MKTYHSSTKGKAKFGRRQWYIVIASISALLIATAVTLSIVFTNLPSNVPNIPVDNTPKFTAPIKDYTLGQEASLKKLVYNPTLNQWRTHNGIDLVAKEGSFVTSVMDGKVTSIENTTLEGTVITVTHANGLTSIYKSLAKEVAVAKGQDIKTGDKLGTLASNMLTEKKVGCHLHLEMKSNGKLVNPLEYLTDISPK